MPLLHIRDLSWRHWHCPCIKCAHDDETCVLSGGSQFSKVFESSSQLPVGEGCLIQAYKRRGGAWGRSENAKGVDNIVARGCKGRTTMKTSTCR